MYFVLYAVTARERESETEGSALHNYCSNGDLQASTSIKEKKRTPPATIELIIFGSSFQSSEIISLHIMPSL